MNNDRALSIALKFHELADAYTAVELRYSELLRRAIAEPDQMKPNKQALKGLREVGEEFLALGAKMIRTANYVEPLLDEIQKGRRDG